MTTKKIILTQKADLPILEEMPPITFYNSKQNELYFPITEFYRLGCSIFELNEIVPPSTRLEAIYNRQKIEVIPSSTAYSAFMQIDKPIFQLLGEKLLLKGVEAACKHIKRGEFDIVQGIKVRRDYSGQLLFEMESMGISTEEFNERFEELKEDVTHWQKKLDSLEYLPKKEIEVRPHPSVEMPKRVEIKGKVIEDAINLPTVAHMIVHYIANPDITDDGG